MGGGGVSVQTTSGGGGGGGGDGGDGGVGGVAWRKSAVSGLGLLFFILPDMLCFTGSGCHPWHNLEVQVTVFYNPRRQGAHTYTPRQWAAWDLGDATSHNL